MCLPDAQQSRQALAGMLCACHMHKNTQRTVFGADERVGVPLELRLNRHMLVRPREGHELGADELPAGLGCGADWG